MPEKKEIQTEEKTDKELLLEQIKGLITDSVKEGVTKADLDARIEEINKKLKVINDREDNHEELKTIKESVEKLLQATAENAAAIKAMNEQPGKNESKKPKTFYDAIMEGIGEAAKNIPNLITEKEGDGKKKKSLNEYFDKLGNKTTPAIKIDFPVSRLTRKDAVDMTEGNIVGNYVDLLRLTQLDPNRVGIPLTLYPHVTDWMPSKDIDRPKMSILVVGTYVDGSGTKAEGVASSKSSFLLTTVEFPSFVIGTHFKFSDETLEDIEEVVSEVSITGPDKLLDEVDDQILGTAGDDSTAIAGLLTANKMTAFAATWDGTIPSAKIVDLIEKMKLQCLGNKYRPDTIVMNPTDLSNMGSEKDQLDNSITDRRVVYSTIGEPTYICGLEVKRSTSITANTMVVLDKTKLQIGDRRAMTLEFGYDADDFTVGKKTARLSVRLAFGVRDKAAVIYSADIDGDITEITNV